MSVRNKFQPYIRRANGRERAETWRMAFRLAFYRGRKRPFYVMVQRGFPHLAIERGESRQAIKDSILVVHLRDMSFTQWTRRIGRHARCKGGQAR